MLQWAREQGCPWDGATCANAAAGGHLEVLRWAREHGGEWDEDTTSMAAEGGHLVGPYWLTVTNSVLKAPISFQGLTINCFQRLLSPI